MKCLQCWPTCLGLGLHLWTWRKALKNRKGNTHHFLKYFVFYCTPQKQSHIRRVIELLCGLGQGISPFCYNWNNDLYYCHPAGPGSLRDIYPHHWGKPWSTCWGPGGAFPRRPPGSDNRYPHTEPGVLTCPSRERMKEQERGVIQSALGIL